MAQMSSNKKYTKNNNDNMHLNLSWRNMRKGLQQSKKECERKLSFYRII